MLNPTAQNPPHLFHCLFTEKECGSVEMLSWESGNRGSLFLALPLTNSFGGIEQIACNSSECQFLHHLKSLDTLGFLTP